MRMFSNVLAAILIFGLFAWLPILALWLSYSGAHSIQQVNQGAGSGATGKPVAEMMESAVQVLDSVAKAIEIYERLPAETKTIICLSMAANTDEGRAEILRYLESSEARDRQTALLTIMAVYSNSAEMKPWPEAIRALRGHIVHATPDEQKLAIGALLYTRDWSREKLFQDTEAKHLDKNHIATISDVLVEMTHDSDFERAEAACEAMDVIGEVFQVDK